MKQLNDPRVRAALSWAVIAFAGMVVITVTFILPDDWMRPDRPVSSVAVAAPQEGQSKEAEGGEGKADGTDDADAPAPRGEGAIPMGDVAPVQPDPQEFIDQLPAVGEPADASAPAPIEIPSGRIEHVPDGERDWHIHVVVPVETVDQIAHRYAVRPDALRMWNGLPEGADSLKNGSQLRVKPRRIPPPRFFYEYVVQPRDSWWSIGTKFGVDSYDLRAYNWNEAQRLKVGQKLQMWLDPVVFEWIAVEERPDDPTAIRPGAVGSGPPQDGRLINGVEIPDSPYWERKLPPSSYGTSFAIEVLMEAIARFESRVDYEPPLVFGSMSYKHGGPIEGHRSHQTGRDLDIRLPLKQQYPQWYEVTNKRVDWEALWHLVSAFHDTGEVLVIFFDYEMQEGLYKAAKRVGSTPEERKAMLQYPYGQMAGGFLRHSSGHEAHIHVRFDCGPHEPECIPTAGPHEIDGG